MAAWAILREARARAGLSQRALAQRAGVAQSEIARVEAGRQEPAYRTLERLVRAAGFDLRVQLAPHDHHDEQLIEDMLDRPVEDRIDSLRRHVAFAASIRELGDGTRS
ncbi:MAG: helix-turn-helix domain-containing protein [Gaiellaceae bacterium]